VRRKPGQAVSGEQDFVAEMAYAIYMLEPEAANQMADPEVLAKEAVAVTLVSELVRRLDA
jgi:hypothetical protein